MLRYFIIYVTNKPFTIVSLLTRQLGQLSLNLPLGECIGCTAHPEQSLERFYNSSLVTKCQQHSFALLPEGAATIHYHCLACLCSNYPDSLVIASSRPTNTVFASDAELCSQDTKARGYHIPQSIEIAAVSRSGSLQENLSRKSLIPLLALRSSVTVWP